MIGKSYSLALLAVLALSLCKPQLLSAQVSTQGNQGPWHVRQPHARAVVRAAPIRSAAGFRPVRTEAFSISGGRMGPSHSPHLGGRPIYRRHSQPSEPALLCNRPEYCSFASITHAGLQPSQSRNRPELRQPRVPRLGCGGGAGLAEQAPAAPSGIELPAVSTFNAPRGGMGEASRSPRSGQPYVRSTELSDRLTQIASSKGMLSGEGIDVFVSNDITILRGAVHTAGNRALLANLLALEPEVQQIDNQLVVDGAGPLSANPTNR